MMMAGRIKLKAKGLSVRYAWVMVVALASPGNAQAQPSGAPRPRRIVSLDYRISPGAKGCPTEDVFRDAVGARIQQRDAFSDASESRLTVVLDRTRAGYEGSAELNSEARGAEWSRAFSATPSCIDLIEDLAVAVALHIDPPIPLPAPKSLPSKPPSPQRPPPAPPPSPLPLPKPSRPRVTVRLGTSVGVEIGTTLAFASSADAGMRLGAWSAAIEGRWTPAAARATTSGVELDAQRLSAGLVLCAHRAWVALCGVGQVGQFRASVDSPASTPTATAMAFAGFGGRVGVEFPLISHLALRVSGELMGFPRRPRILVGDATAWESGILGGGLFVGLLSSF